MEDSNTRAKYIEDFPYAYNIFEKYTKDNVNEHIKNVSDLGITDYNFGDLVALDEYRDYYTYFIGKNGNLIQNNDCSPNGWLHIPYEITKYLDNATRKYTDIDYHSIDLNITDNIIIDYIGKIPKSWNLKINKKNFSNIIYITFPNGSWNEFDILNTTPYKIKNWYKSSLKAKISIKLELILKDENYDRFVEKYGDISAIPKLTSVWSIDKSDCLYSSRYYKVIYSIEGPDEKKHLVIPKINKFYKGFDYHFLS